MIASRENRLRQPVRIKMDEEAASFGNDSHPIIKEMPFCVSQPMLCLAAALREGDPTAVG